MVSPSGTGPDPDGSRKRWFLLTAATVGVAVVGLLVARPPWRRGAEPGTTKPQTRSAPAVPGAPQGARARRDTGETRDGQQAGGRDLHTQGEGLQRVHGTNTTQDPEDLSDVPPQGSPASSEPPGRAPLPGEGLDPEEAVAALRQDEMALATRLLEQFPRSAGVLALVGNVYRIRGNTEEALSLWNRCLEMDPKRTDVYEQIGWVAMRQGEYEKAVQLWRKALELNPKLPEVRNAMGRALMGLGRTREAVEMLEADVKISPGAAWSHFLLGQCRMQLKEYEQAKQSYEAAVRIQPKFTNAYYGLALAHTRLGHREKAREYREKFRALKAEEMKVLKDQNEAYDDVESVRRNIAKTYTAAGQVCAKHGRVQQAVGLWQRAADFDPNNTLCRLCLGVLYQSTNRHEEALQIYRQLMAIEPANPEHCLNAGRLHVRLKQFDAAEQAFRETSRLAPQSSLGYRELARLYLMTNKETVQAKALASRAVQLEPTALNYAILSSACYQNGDPDGALSAIKRAIELDPGNTQYQRTYAWIQARK